MSRKGEIPELIFEDEKTRISKAFYGPSDDFYESLSTAIQSNQWAQNDKLRIELEGEEIFLCNCLFLCHVFNFEKNRHKMKIQKKLPKKMKNMKNFLSLFSFFQEC